MRTPDEREGDLDRADRRQSRGRDAAARHRRAIRPRAARSRYAAALQDYTERVVRAAIRAIPDGRYEFEDALDDDGFGDDAGDDSRGRSRSRGDRATVDFTGSAPQVEGSVNANYAMTLSACLYAFRCLVGDDVLYNAGVGAAADGHRAARDRSSTRAGRRRWPAATSRRRSASPTSCFGALGKALPDRMPAASQGTMNNVTLGGTRSAHRPPVRVLRDDGRRHGRAARAAGPSAACTRT